MAPYLAAGCVPVVLQACSAFRHGLRAADPCESRRANLQSGAPVAPYLAAEWLLVGGVGRVNGVVHFSTLIFVCLFDCTCTISMVHGLTPIKKINDWDIIFSLS